MTISHWLGVALLASALLGVWRAVEINRQLRRLLPLHRRSAPTRGLPRQNDDGVFLDVDHFLPLHWRPELHGSRGVHLVQQLYLTFVSIIALVGFGSTLLELLATTG